MDTSTEKQEDAAKNEVNSRENDSQSSRSNSMDSKSGKELWSVSVCRIIKVLAILILLDVIVSLCGFFLCEDFSPAVDIIAGVLVFIMALFLFVSPGFTIIIRKSNGQREDCPFITKETCPYSCIDDCPYNTNHCCSFKKEPGGKWRYNVLVLIFIISLLFFIASFFDLRVIQGKWIEIPRSISLSVIVASVMAFLVDIPGKMKEYQSYFVDLLSSNEYLKQMDESSLLDLRSKITWILHSKDIPNMPRGFIDLDRKLCDMLCQPYFKDYSQINDVKKVGDEFVKTIKTQYRAFNPYRSSRPVIMDIGLGIEMIVPNYNLYQDDVLLKQFVKEKLRIKRFAIVFDDRDEEVDLRPYICIVFKRHERGDRPKTEEDSENKVGRVQIHILRKEDIEKELSDIIIDNNKVFDETKDEIDVKLDQNMKTTQLKCEFKDKIHVELEYVIKITETDKLFTKKLRYPVKYLYFEYSFDKSTTDYELDGQLIGTMIEPSDKLINVSEDKRHITMRTNSWLLPRNGAVVVINKRDEKAG